MNKDEIFIDAYKLPKHLSKQEVNQLLEKVKNGDETAKTKIVEQDTDVMTKEDYLKILELLKTPIFTKMMSVFSPKEVMIVSLKLGYIDNKCFSARAISEFLGIEQQEVIDIIKKVLLAYKERINQMMDSAIQIVISEQEISSSSSIKTFHK